MGNTTEARIVTLYALILRDSLVTQLVKILPAMWETWVHSLGWEDLQRKKWQTHLSPLSWRSPWTEETGRL